MTSVKSKLFAVKKKRAASEWMRRVGVGSRWERQPPKGGWIIVAPGWLAYLGLVV